MARSWFTRRCGSTLGERVGSCGEAPARARRLPVSTTMDGNLSLPAIASYVRGGPAEPSPAASRSVHHEERAYHAMAVTMYVHSVNRERILRNSLFGTARFAVSARGIVKFVRVLPTFSFQSGENSLAKDRRSRDRAGGRLWRSRVADLKSASVMTGESVGHQALDLARTGYTALPMRCHWPRRPLGSTASMDATLRRWA